MTTLLVVGDELAFPEGSASTVFVRRFTRGVTLAGTKAAVVCLDYTERTNPPRNTAARGARDGVEFVYTTGDPILPRSPPAIALGRARSALRLGRVLDEFEGPRVAVYYGRYPSVLLRLWRACRARAIPLLASVVEWRLAFREQTIEQRLGDALFHRLLPRLAGSIVISRFIEEELRARGATHPILRVPILVDPEEWRGVASWPTPRPYVLMCADFDSYPAEATMVVEACAPLDVELHLVGKMEHTRTAIERVARAHGSTERLQLVSSFVPDAELRSRYVGASALLAPLRDDDRSRARFPSKIADYLASGRPVVSARVGEVDSYLRDGVTAFLHRPDDLASMRDAIRRALEDPRRDAIAAAGRDLAFAELSLEHQGKRIAEMVRRFT